MHPILAIRAFFAVLFGNDVAKRVKDCLENKPPEVVTPRIGGVKPSDGPVAKTPPISRSKSTGRSEALTLLSALQREARLLDLICEPIDGYTDAQIGAASRDVLRDSRKTLDRMFGLKPLIPAEEGSEVELPAEASPIRWRVVGKESSRATLTHPGWQATKIDMPEWSGSSNDALIISAAEVET
jgi:hypothetical protein